MQVTLSHLLNFLTGSQSGGVWFAATGIVGCIVLMRVIPEMPGIPASHWLKVIGVGALTLGFLVIAAERLWYSLDSNGNSLLSPDSLAAALARISVVLFLLGVTLLVVHAIRRGIAREELPLMHTKRKMRWKRERLR